MSPETQYPKNSRNDRASEVRYRSDPRTRAAHAQHARNDARMRQQGRPAAGTASPYASRQGSAGKTFLFGFLGALVACALSFGGFVAWQTFSGTNANEVKESASIPSDEAESGIALGSQNPTVVEDGTGSITLAEAVAAKATPSVGCIYVYSAQSNYYNYYGASDTGGSGELTQSSLGSGIVLTEDGYILTNYHVIENSDALKVNIEGTEYDAQIVGTDPSSDLAVIKAQDASGLTPADIGDSDDLTVGEWVMTVGSPFGLESSVATGVVSATSRSSIMENNSNYMYGYAGGSSEPTLYPNMIQTDAAINPGNSGGALVDADGKVIGVNTLITSYSGNYSGVGFAIPINYAINIADQIIAGKTPTHAKMGVSISTVNSSVAKRYNLSVDAGAYVTEVVAGSGAEQAGIQVGDIITALDGTAVKTATDLSLAIRAHEPGATVPIMLNRNGKELELEVVLGSDESDLQAQQQQQQQQQQQPYQQRGYGLTYEELLELLNSL